MEDTFKPTKLAQPLGFVSIACFIDTRSHLNNNKYPVKIRITYKHNRIYYSTRESASKEEWHDLDSNTNKKWTAIQRKYNEIAGHIEDMNEKNEEFSFDKLALLMGRGIKNDVISSFKARIKELRDDEQLNTAISYESALSMIKGYTGTDKLSFDRINVEWLKAFEKYMIKKEKSKATQGIYLRCLRAILNAAGKKLFGKDKFKFKDDSRRQMAITKDEMDKLLHHPVINKSVTHRMRDMFEFSYRCNACNFKDLVNLKWDNIKDGEIIWERAKTKVEIIAAINARMQEIIDTWGDEDSEYIFGLINDKMSAREKQLAVNNTVRLCNDHLKIITKEAGLPKCSTYTVRHTFITLMLEHEPITTVSWLAGHKTTLMVQRYANTPKKEKRKQISEIL